MPASDHVKITFTDSPRDIVVLEAGGIGDAVMATPALGAIRRHFPAARISVVLAPRTVEIVQALGLDLEIRTLRLGRKLGQLTDAARLIVTSRRRKPDLLVDLSSIESDSARTKRRMLVKLIGAKHSLGRNTDGRGGFFDAAMDESLFDEEHEVERKVRALAPLGIEVENPQPHVNVSDSAAQAAGAALAEAGVGDDAELVGINPGSFLPTRRWPAENFVQLASVLTKDGRALLVTGGKQERELAGRVADAARGESVRAVARPLMEVAALIGRCRVFVTNDTAAMHIAAAQGVPVVALFGRSNARRYRPYAPKDRYILLQQPAEDCDEFAPGSILAECRKRSCPSRKCMTGISFESVHAAVQELLARTTAAA